MRPVVFAACLFAVLSATPAAAGPLICVGGGTTTIHGVGTVNPPSACLL